MHTETPQHVAYNILVNSTKENLLFQCLHLFEHVGVLYFRVTPFNEKPKLIVTIRHNFDMSYEMSGAVAKPKASKGYFKVHNNHRAFGVIFVKN